MLSLCSLLRGFLRDRPGLRLGASHMSCSVPNVFLIQEDYLASPAGKSVENLILLVVAHGTVFEHQFLEVGLAGEGCTQ